MGIVYRNMEETVDLTEGCWGRLSSLAFCLFAMEDTPCLKIHRKDPPTREKENIQERGRFPEMQEGWILEHREEGPHVGYNKEDGWDGFACVMVGSCEFLFDDFQRQSWP